MDLLLREYLSSGYEPYRNAVELTLERMGNGGIYDHLGGGICRYSTDPKWLVPHFEKMLYDQGLVASIYVDAWQATERDELKRLRRENIELQTDKEILRRAAAYFARETMR